MGAGKRKCFVDEKEWQQSERGKRLHTARGWSVVQAPHRSTGLWDPVGHGSRRQHNPLEPNRRPQPQAGYL